MKKGFYGMVVKYEVAVYDCTAISGVTSRAVSAFPLQFDTFEAAQEAAQRLRADGYEVTKLYGA